MNGSQPFVYLWTCGCVFSHSGLRALAGTPPPREDSGKLEKKEQKDNEPAVQLEMCPQCGAKYHKTEDVLLLNPSPEDESKMFETMIMRRASEPVKTKGKKRKAAAVDADTAQPAAKKSHASGAPSINPNIASASRAVANSLAQEEAKRKANMSDAVKSLYEPKAGSKKNETFMTRGTFTRVRSTTFVHHTLYSLYFSGSMLNFVLSLSLCSISGCCNILMMCMYIVVVLLPVLMNSHATT